MAQLTINVGTVANDNTGDPIRTAFEKCNSNFDEAYATGMIGSDLIVGSDGTNLTSIQTAVVDADITIQANGLGNIIMDNDTLRITTPKTPADLVNGDPADVAGDIAWDADYIYVCVNSFGTGTPVWKRATLA